MDIPLGKCKIVIANPLPDDKPWECFPLSIDEDAGDECLVCCLQLRTTGWWENWNLGHTLQGLSSGYYRLERLDELPVEVIKMNC